MSDNASDRGLAVRERRRHALDRGILFLFLIGGSASIVALKLSPVPIEFRIGIPVGLIVAYALLTISRTRFRLRYDQAGDNCYYMGFIFTLVSLGIALYQIRQGSSAQEFGIGVVRDFGLALSTTIAGIICRVSLTQLREDPHDIEEATRRELIDYSRALSGQMQASVGMLAEVRQTTEDRLKNYVFEMGQVVGEHQRRTEEMRDSTKKLSDSIGKLAADFASTEIPTGKLRDATAATMNAIGALNETLGRANTALSDIEGTSRAVAESYRQRLRAGNEMAEQETRTAAALAGSAGATSAFSDRTRELTAALQEARGGAEALKGMEDEVRAVTEALRTATRSIAGASSRLATAEAALSDQMVTAEGAASSLSAQIDALADAQERLRAAPPPQAAPQGV
jgi:predicted  nucleic acid-binding Zn-ribbon protein